MEKYFAIIEQINGKFFASSGMWGEILLSDWFSGLSENEENSAAGFMETAAVGESIEIAGIELKCISESECDWDVVEVKKITVNP